jgi:hypothetical protein
MATLTPRTPTLAGTNPSPAAADVGGDEVANPRGNIVLRVDNGGGTPITVTLAAQQTTRPKDGTFPDMTLEDQEITVTNAQSRLIGPIPPAFNDADGNVQITYSGVDSVTIEAIQLP